MEDFIRDVELYARQRGLKPSTVFQYATKQSASRWAALAGGDAQILPRTMQAVRRYMADNPPQEVA